MKRIALMTMLLLGLPLLGTGCDATIIGDVPFVAYDLGGGGTGGDGGGGTTFIPGRPLPGMLIDRVGRPGINLALTNPFSLATGMTPDQVKNLYNVSVPANWTAFAARPYIAENLAVYDGLDGTCGNQLLAGGTAVANRYSVLANALADDRLYINANTGVCNTYLAVEEAKPGVVDCGGYHPSMNAMDITFNLLVSGQRAPAAANSFSNGITADVDGGIAFNAMFPFLRAPN